MIELNNVTLICVDCYNYGGAVAAMKKSLQQIKPARAVLLTDINIVADGIEVIQIPKIKSKREYSEFIIKQLSNYFDTDFVLVIQHDGYVLDANQWDERYLNFDYIGASWIYDDERNVGNGGFSIRSKMLQKVLAEDENIVTVHPEDATICLVYKFYLEDNYGIKFATEELADKFSYELRTPIQPTFGFHGHFHEPYKQTVIIKRTAAFGDVISVEPVLEYFHNKGCRVVLDTLPQFKMIFRSHYFKIEFVDEIDPRLLSTAIVYNLDMSYESKPKQLHLKTYYEYCNVPESEMVIKNPKLSLGFTIENDNMKLIKNKYVLLHIDNREQPHRNIYGIDWEWVAMYLRTHGYEVYQVGRDDFSEVKGVPKINTINESILAYLVAGASFFIGIDSGISHIASGFKIPSILFFGAVNPEYIHPNLDNIKVIHNHNDKVCDTPYCWHDCVGTAGQECYISPTKPPCTKFKVTQLIDYIKEIHEHISA